jgi:hypothetical protein
LDGINRTTPAHTRRRENEDSDEEARRVRPRTEAPATAGPAGLANRAALAPAGASLPPRHAVHAMAPDSQRPQWSGQSDTSFQLGSPARSQGAADSEELFRQWLSIAASPLPAAGASMPTHPSPAHSLAAPVSGPAQTHETRDVQSTHGPAASARAPVNAGQAPPVQPAFAGAGGDADDHQLRFLYEHEAGKQKGSGRMDKRRGLALSKFAEFLKRADAQDGLRNFLSRQHSDVESIRQQAAAQLAQFIDQAPAGRARNDRRGHTNAALATLGAIPAQERHLPAEAIAQLKPAEQLKLLSAQDQALLQRLRNEAGIDPLYVLKLRAALVRFAVALAQSGEAGLTGWLAMYRDGRQAQANGLMEAIAGEAGMNRLPEAARRLQELGGVNPASSIQHIRRQPPTNVFPPGFPQSEAVLISAATESMHVQNEDEHEGAAAVADTTAAARRRELIAFSIWLRRPPAQGASAHPGGLADLLALQREAIAQLRDEYLSQSGGMHSTMLARRSTLKLALTALPYQAGPAPVGAGSAVAQAAGGAPANAPQFGPQWSSQSDAGFSLGSAARSHGAADSENLFHEWLANAESPQATNETGEVQSAYRPAASAAAPVSVGQAPPAAPMSRELEHRETLPVQAPRLAPARPALLDAEADDYQFRFLYEHEARKQQGLGGTIKRRGMALVKFAAFLKKADAQDGLRNFVSRQQSDVESIRQRAAAELADFIDQAPEGSARNDRRNHVNAALATLGAIPAEERHLAPDTVRNFRPDDQLKLLSVQDQALVQRLRNETEAGPQYALQLRAALIRFATALVQRGEAGLAGWLAMHHDGRHAEANELQGSVAGEAGMNRLAEAARLLQMLDKVDPANLIPHGRGLPSKGVFPPGFPGAEAELISAATESMQVQSVDDAEGAASAVSDSTAAARRLMMIGLSNWLRRPPGRGGPGHPGGLADLLALEHGGEREAIERLRDEYLSQLGGAPQTMRVRRSTLKMALNALLRPPRPAQAVAGSAAAQPAVGSAGNVPQPGIDGAVDLDSLSLSSLISLPQLDPLPATPGGAEVQSRLMSQAHQPSRSHSAASSGLDSLWLSSLMSSPSLDSLPATSGEPEVQSRPSSQALRAAEPTPAQSETDSTALFERYLAEMSDAVESRARQAPAAPPIDGLLRAMSMLQSARRHGAPMHVGNAASAVGLQADQLSTFITEEGRLRDTQQVRDWLLELPLVQRDAVLKFGTA